MSLRDFQAEAVEKSFGEWETVRSTLVVCPTGTGKTRIAVEIGRRFQPQRTMFVAHRGELVRQARDSFWRFAKLDCGIEQAEQSLNEGMFKTPVVCAMVQTLNSKSGMERRMGKFNPKEFGLLVIDEAHHGVADSYKNVINYFTQNPKLKILCITATPDRADEEALGQIIDSVAFDYEIEQAIHDGWLVPVNQYRVHVKGLDFSHIHTVAGDLNQGELAKVMEAEDSIQGVVQPTLETMFSLDQGTLSHSPVLEWGQLLLKLGNPKRTLIFTVSVLQAEMLCNIFNRVIPGLFAWVCGETAQDVREDMLRRYNGGEIAGIVNCNCLSEGFDSPAVEIVVQARPTKSRCLYAQQLGRSTRPLPGIVDGPPTAEERRAAIASSDKPCCTVLDFVGNSGKHKLVTSADILGGKFTDKAIDRANKLAEKLGKPVPMLELLEQSEKLEQEEVLRRKQQEEARKMKLVARANYQSSIVSPFDVFDITPAKPRGWDSGRTLSERQKKVLLSNGVDPNSLPYQQARQLLDEMFRRWGNGWCGLKLARSLKKRGLSTEVSTAQAVQMLRGAPLTTQLVKQTKEMPEDVEQFLLNWR